MITVKQQLKFALGLKVDPCEVRAGGGISLGVYSLGGCAAFILGIAVGLSIGISI